MDVNGGAAPPEDKASEGQGQHHEHKTRLDSSARGADSGARLWANMGVRDAAGAMGPCKVSAGRGPLCRDRRGMEQEGGPGQGGLLGTHPSPNLSQKQDMENLGFRRLWRGSNPSQ